VIRVGPDFRVPQPLDLGALLTLVFVIDAINRSGRDFDTFTITSWGRTALQNAAAGGRENSLHKVGRAIDIDTDAMAAFRVLDFLTFQAARRASLGAVQRVFARIAPPFTQAVDEDDHLHLELDIK